MWSFCPKRDRIVSVSGVNKEACCCRSGCDHMLSIQNILQDERAQHDFPCHAMMLCERYPSDRCKVVHNIAISQLCQQALLNSRRTTTPRLLVVLGVTVTTSWQPDRLAQSELFDEKTRRVVPDYYEI